MESGRLLISSFDHMGFPPVPTCLSAVFLLFLNQHQEGRSLFFFFSRPSVKTHLTTGHSNNDNSRFFLLTLKSTTILNHFVVSLMCDSSSQGGVCGKYPACKKAPGPAFNVLLVHSGGCVTQDLSLLCLQDDLFLNRGTFGNRTSCLGEVLT